MRLVVFGVGYVGLVTGTGLADIGHQVLCVDIDESKISSLRRGEIPIYEPGLSDLVQRGMRADRLHFETKLLPPFDASDIYFVAVGTPPNHDGSADLRAVFASCEAIAAVAKSPGLVVIKSTVPVGTCDEVQAKLESLSPGKFQVVSNPEFLKEGAAIEDFMKPDRIVVGVKTESAASLMRSLYAPLQLSGERFIVTDYCSSELIKYASNTMLAMRVSFMNELSRLCHKTGASIHAIRAGMGADSRIGKKFLYAGPGYGGSCFPKDVRALASLARSKGTPLLLAEATQEVNSEQISFVFNLIRESLGDLSGKRVTFWGLAFKPETDDVRDAPSLELAHLLTSAGASIVGHDPEAADNFIKAAGSIDVCVVQNEYDALENSDALVLLTEWRCYRSPNFARIREKLQGDHPLVLDARNIWSPVIVNNSGLKYLGIGVPPHALTRV